MTENEKKRLNIKENIKRKLQEQNISQNAASLYMGRDKDYLTQFFTKDSPKRLNEINRKKLAELLNCPEQELTDISLDQPALPAHLSGTNMVAAKITSAVSSFFKKPLPDTVGIEMLDVSACCGTGIDNLSENIVGIWQMPLMDFKGISQTSPDKIKIVKAVGDSMQPTINDGDFVFVDISNQSMGSDGIYVLSAETGLSIKRLQNDYNGSITIISDNKLYNARPIPLSDIRILGRVVNIVNLRKI